MRLVKLLRRYWQWSTANRRNANIDYYVGAVVIFALLVFWFATDGDYGWAFFCLLAIGVTAVVIRRERRRKA